MVLLTDSRELLKVLAERQMGVHDKLEPAMSRFQAAGMESILIDAKHKAERTESDVQKLGQWLAQCDEMA
jgi:Mg-chelatase subunit ChlD